jgi:hypothetical protein
MTDEDWADTVKRNKEHLEIMVAKDFWTTEDLTPFKLRLRNKTRSHHAILVAH